MKDTNEMMPHVLFDHARINRIGLPEAVFCEGKDFKILLALLEEFKNSHPILFTRLNSEIFEKIPSALQAYYNYHQLSRTAFSLKLPDKKYGNVAVVSAGSADGFVTWEVARTLEYLGIKFKVFEDNGVSGLWRLSANLKEINEFSAIIIIAGLDAALASVLGGLTAKPIFAVPTSVGYGMANNGKTALNSMLVSCAPGVAVFNIDNGYGAACAAARIINMLN